MVDVWQSNITYSVNPLYLIFRYLSGYLEEINENKYLMLDPINESQEKIMRPN